jgi:hypothetical protein
MTSDKPKLHSTDEALIHSAATGEGLVPLTSDIMRTIGEGFDKRQADIDARYPELVKACPYETRLAVAAWVIRAICDHGKEGGSFRYLIYDRLGFGPDAYFPLYTAGGMEISNNFTLEGANADRTSDDSKS